MNQLTYLKRGLAGEVLKYKNTFALYLAILAPTFISVIYFFVFYLKGDKIITEGANPWPIFVNYVVLIGIAMLFPLFVILIGVLVNHNEHISNTWKHLYAMPLPRSTTFISKVLVCLGLVTLAVIVFTILTFISAYVLSIVRPELHFQDYNYTKELLRICWLTYLSSFGMLSIQFWLSIRFKNILLPLGLGIAGFVFSIILQQWKGIVYFPYSYTFCVTMLTNNADFVGIPDQVWYSLGVAIVVFVLAFWDTYRRDVV